MAVFRAFEEGGREGKGRSQAYQLLSIDSNGSRNVPEPACSVEVACEHQTVRSSFLASRTPTLSHGSSVSQSIRSPLLKKLSNRAMKGLLLSRREVGRIPRGPLKASHWYSIQGKVLFSILRKSQKLNSV